MLLRWTVFTFSRKKILYESEFNQIKNDGTKSFLKTKKLEHRKNFQTTPEVRFHLRGLYIFIISLLIWVPIATLEEINVVKVSGFIEVLIWIFIVASFLTFYSALSTINSWISSSEYQTVMERFYKHHIQKYVDKVNSYSEYKSIFTSNK